MEIPSVSHLPAQSRRRERLTGPPEREFDHSGLIIRHRQLSLGRTQFHRPGGSGALHHTTISWPDAGNPCLLRGKKSALLRDSGRSAPAEDRQLLPINDGCLTAGQEVLRLALCLACELALARRRRPDQGQLIFR